MIAAGERPPDKTRHPRLPLSGLVVRRWGSGPEVVLVHGSVTGAHASWAELRRRVRGWTLVAPNRRGYHPRTPASREDFRADAADIVQLCRRPVHLVGHSYGAVVALLAAVHDEDVSVCLDAAQALLSVDHEAAQKLGLDWGEPDLGLGRRSGDLP